MNSHGRSLKWRLATLSLGLLLPTLVFVGVLLWRFSVAERGRVEEEARGLSRSFAVALDRELNGVLTTLQALATSPSLQLDDIAAFYEQCRKVSELQGINISLRDTAGHAVMTTRAPFGSTVATPKVLADADQEILRSGKALVTNIFKSTVTNVPVFQIIEAPVVIGGAPKFLLGASIEVDYLADMIRREHLPPDWVGSIIDRNGAFVARTDASENVAGTMTSAAYRARTPADAGSYFGLNSRGQQVLLGYAQSSLSGWTTSASLPTEAVEAPLRRSLLALVALGLALAAVAIGIASRVGRNLASAFDRLGMAAASLGEGRPVAPLTTGVIEVNQVASALHVAARQLQDRARERDVAETALRDLAGTLEEQVVVRTRERNRLWETTNDLVGIGTLDGSIKAANPAWTTLLGWTEEELLARPFIDFVDPDDHSGLADIVGKLSAGETVGGFVDRVITKSGGRRTVMWSAVPVLKENLFYMVGRDLTEQRQAEDALRQSQKMEAVGQLTGGIAHDFNNMLAVILGSLNLLQRRLARGETNVTRYVDTALEGATRAATLTQRLLAFSRRQPLSPETIEINRLVSGVTELLTRTLGEQNIVETVLAAGLWKARVDPGQLESAILNLAVNARDAMPDGGRLTIETGNAHIDTDYAANAGIPVGQYVMIAISDTGSGMSPDVVAKAFDPFFTTKDVGKGTGLGLSQVFGFARQSGGHVKIYSELDHGTTIKLYLPRSYEVAAAANVPKKLQADVAGDPREIIMVVEDEDRVRSYAVEALRDLGYTVVHASSGPEAIGLFDRGQDATLLFTDIVMPGMTGRQLVDAMAPRRPGMKVLYTTGYSRNAVVHNGILDPGTNLLVKPFGIDQLATAVRQVLDT